MQLLTIPTGEVGLAHRHEDQESAIDILRGSRDLVPRGAGAARDGGRGGFRAPANVPHTPYIASADEPCVALIVRPDPDEQEIVVLIPELDSLLQARGAAPRIAPARRVKGLWRSAGG